MATVYEQIKRSQGKIDNKSENNDFYIDGDGKKPVIFEIILALIPIIALITYHFLKKVPGFADKVSNHFSMSIREFMGGLCSRVSFSIMELVYTLAGLLLIYYIVCTIIKTVKSNKKLKTLISRLLLLILIIIYIWALYCWVYGIGYYAETFTKKSGLSSDGISVEDLADTAAYFRDQAKSLCTSVQRDENGLFTGDINQFFIESDTVYDNIESEFSFLRPVSAKPKKMVFYSKVMSRLDFTGVYFPFLGESNINIDVPKYTIPCTIAHEFAHQRGICSEAECNFLGIAASTSSCNPKYEYSGYMVGLTYLMNALYQEDHDMWTEIRAGYDPLMEKDLAANTEYWDSMESPISEASSAVYDGYLKANGQELGIKSYGACVDLLVTYYSGKIR